MKIVVSVPHTGSNFLKMRFGCDYIHHTWMDWHDIRRVCDEADQIFVPLRHPKSVFDTWGKRYHMNGVSRWYKAWLQLQALDSIYPMDVVAVDLKQDERITNWSKEFSQSSKPRPDRMTDPRLWQSLMDLPLVRRYYNDGG